MSRGRRIHRVRRPWLAVFLLATVAHAQDTGSGPATQLWLNLTSGWTKSHRLHLELDTEGRWQVGEGERWGSLDATPLVAYYPADWLDLEAEAKAAYTHQNDGLDTVELTPRVGARFHLFAKLAPRRPGIPGLKYDRFPLTRLGFSTLFRLEWRNLWYSDDTPNKHVWRARLRVEGMLAVNRPKLSEDRLLYAIADAEYYWPLGEGVSETYVNKLRARVGLGYRFSAPRRLELLYVRDWNRSSPNAEAVQDVQALYLRLKLLF